MVLLLIRTKFCQDTVQFSRLTTIDGLTPSESILSSIQEFSIPHRYYKCTILVWAYEPGLLGIFHEPNNEAIYRSA